MKENQAISNRGRIESHRRPRTRPCSPLLSRTFQQWEHKRMGLRKTKANLVDYSRLAPAAAAAVRLP
jgi:hypothetical protein